MGLPITLITAFPSQMDSRPQCARLREAGSQVKLLFPAQMATEDETIDLLKGVTAFVAANEPLSERVLGAARDLKIIARTGVGVDSIDVRAAHARGIRVTITPGLTSKAVADLAMGLMLAAARGICLHDSAIRQGRWERTIGADLEGKTLGLLGLGAIGKLVAKRALAFDMHVVACDLVQDDAFAAAQGISYVPRDQLLKQSDYVSLHLPLTAETRGGVGARELRQMKPTAYLINTSRGPVVDEPALVQALREGWIAGAGLDVFAQEPPRESPLLTLSNVVMTPHVGAWTLKTWTGMADQTVEEVIRTLQGQPPLHPV